jgi:glycine cleavage system H lipoate-binding protein
VPVVATGQPVEVGDLVAAVPEGKLGANIHASISGQVVAVNDVYIEISA